MTFKKEHLKTPVMTAMLSAFTAGLFIHFFALANTLYNHDNVNVFFKGYGASVTSGRWFLAVLNNIATRLGLAYNLPFVNGIFFLICVSICAGFAVSAFQIRNRISAALMGAIFISFPTVTSTMMYRFTAPPYGLALILAVAAAWVVPRTLLGVPLSAIMTALSMGIYQAYVPITISMLVLMLLQQTMSESQNWKYVVRDGLLACAALILGVALYMLCNKLALHYTHSVLTNYQGIDTMGQISLAELPQLLVRTYLSVLRLPIENYCGLSSNPIMRFGYLLTGLISLTMVIYIMLVKVRKWSMALLAAGLILVFPIAVNFIVIMCAGSVIYTMMVYAFVIILCAPLALCEHLPPLPRTEQYVSQKTSPARHGSHPLHDDFYLWILR